MTINFGRHNFGEMSFRRLDWSNNFHSSLLFYFSIAGVSLLTYLLMKGELTPEEINMNSMGMFRAGVDTVNTPIITEFIIIIIVIIIIIIINSYRYFIIGMYIEIFIF